MPIDVYVQPTRKPPRRGDDCEHICSFPDDGGYYAFLLPLFKRLQRETGALVDEYGDAAFHSETLNALAQTIAEARLLVAAQPKTWEVVTGVQTHPVHQEVRVTVGKTQMEAFLAQLEEAVRKARAINGYVAFYGD